MAIKKFSDEQFVYEKTAPVKNVARGQHYHDLFEIYFLEKGCCHYFIDDKAYDIEAGDLVLIPENIIHKTMYDETGYSRKLLHFSSSYIPAEVTHKLSTMFYVYRIPAFVPRICAFFEAIESEYRSPDDFSQEVLRHHVGLFFCLLARNTDAAPLPPIKNTYTTETITYIKQHYHEEIRLSDLARRCSVSPEHLSRIFKKDTGFGVSEYISMIRLQQAQRLLRSSPTLSVATVADLCGYTDSNYFSEQFKRTYGISPLRFRNT